MTISCTDEILCLVGLISEEMDLLKLLIRDMVEAVGLVPAVREDIERDLSAYGVGEAVVWELLLQNLDERFSDVGFLNEEGISVM